MIDRNGLDVQNSKMMPIESNSL